jgi:hypothetical protein
MTNVETTKELLSEPRFRIRLYDHVLDQVRGTLSATSEEFFSNTGSWSLDEFIDRLHRYEGASLDLLHTQALIAFWGEPFQQQLITLAPKRLAGQFVPQSGLSAWLALRWYPISLLLYSGGIAAVSARRYTNLKEMLLLSIEDPAKRIRQPLVTAATSPMLDLQDAFKMMPEHDRAFTPRSEYLHTFLRPVLDTALSLDSEYEACFDEFEILYALEHAHQRSLHDGGFWGPPGRFGWKYERGQNGSPYHSLISEAKEAGSSWGPVKGGLFGGSIDRYLDLSAKYAEHLGQLHWR